MHSSNMCNRSHILVINISDIYNYLYSYIAMHIIYSSTQHSAAAYLGMNCSLEQLWKRTVVIGLVSYLIKKNRKWTLNFTSAGQQARKDDQALITRV